MISIIIPANNEEGYIGACLHGLAQSADPAGSDPVQVIVVANGCTDNTVSEARAMTPAFDEKSWQLKVHDLKEGSKILALNTGDATARYDRRIYLDADVRVSRDLVAEVAEVLARPEPVYASGRPVVPTAKSFISRRYARFWEKLPFIARGVPGCGVFAVNGPGRARWGEFPQIISDDTFVRWHFTPDERHGVPATYDWPVIEGFANLVRVRRRQNDGLAEAERLFPDLAERTEVTRPDSTEKLALFLRDPVGFAVYAAVALAVKLPVFRNRGGWDRGR